MVAVLLLMTCNMIFQVVMWVWLYILAYRDYTIRGLTLSSDFKYLIVLLNSSFFVWSVGFWLFCFKNWQTAFELKYLFMMSDEQRTIRHFVLYFAIHALVIGFLATGYLLTSIGGAKSTLDTSLLKLGYYFSYAGEIFTCVFFVDTLRRMDAVIKLIPGLKKSEYVWKLLFIKYIIFFISQTGLLIELETVILKAE